MLKRSVVLLAIIAAIGSICLAEISEEQWEKLEAGIRHSFFAIFGEYGTSTISDSQKKRLSPDNVHLDKRMLNYTPIARMLRDPKLSMEQKRENVKILYEFDKTFFDQDLSTLDADVQQMIKEVRRQPKVEPAQIKA